MLISGSQTPGRAHRDNITQSALNRHARNDRLREHTLIPTRCQAGRLSQPSIATRCCTHWTTLPTVHPHPVPAHALLSPPLLQPGATHTGPLRDRPLSFFFQGMMAFVNTGNATASCTARAQCGIWSGSDFFKCCRDGLLLSFHLLTEVGLCKKSMVANIAIY